MATATQQLQNFIDGELVDAAEGATEPVLNPATGEEIAQAPASRRAGRRPRRRRRARAPSTAGSHTTPGRALARAAQARRRDRGARRRARRARGAPTPASRSQAVKDDEIPRDGRQPALLRGRRAQPGGQGRRASTSRATRRSIRREPVGVVGQIAPWNYPLMMADLEDRPGARDRQHDRPQAGADDAGHDAAARRARGRVPAQGRAQRRRRRQRGRRRRSSPTPTSTWSR